MPTKLTIENIDFPYIIKGSFKKFFPKTTKYLEFILPLRHPSTFKENYKLEDVNVFVVYDLEGEIEKLVPKGENYKRRGFAGGYISELKSIIIDLKKVIRNSSNEELNNAPISRIFKIINITTQ
jgi:hypothetical protein